MKFFYLLIVSLFIHFSAFAQSLSGYIFDDQQQALTGAYILNSSTGEHTHSDINGYFHLEETAKGEQVFISFMGFENKIITVDGIEKDFNIQMIKSSVKIDEVIISPQLNALHLFTDIDMNVNPVNSSQEILNQVPGLFIGQHAGGGKAEQLFLRGFDIDHGTDIAIQVDGMPVNMVSHAHGQGYADLHFVIPETVDHIDFGKGSYYADQGNFNTAGYVEFNTKERLDNNLLKLEVGQFNTMRLLGMLSLLESKKHNAYVATEYQLSDGPFESPQNFDRLNLLAKYNYKNSTKEHVGITFSHFTSSWDASGQIPQRKVDDGSITRFGAIDDTEGGSTSRTNILIDYTRFIDEKSLISNKIFYNLYQFELFSNFTFFLNDPINGDQIQQKENRSLFGFQSEYKRYHKIGDAEINLNVGLNLRSDNSLDNQLSRTANRQEILDRIQYGDIQESNIGLYISSELSLNKWIFNLGLRNDIFRFQYTDNLQTAFTKNSVTRSIISPKINVIYNQSNDLQYYAKFGKGFHSNDTRGVVAKNGLEILPAAYSSDLGIIWKPIKKIILNAGIWNLYSEQEFVYVGDEGVVEPSGRSNRNGIDLSLRYQLMSYLFLQTDANYTLARSLDEEVGEQFIPLAPDFTFKGSLNLVHPNGLFGGLEVRHMGNRAANENNSIVAEGYTIFDTNFGYTYKSTTFNLIVQNLFNAEWNETQFATESRLIDEVEPVEEIHFTPGTPFFIKGSISYSF